MSVTSVRRRDVRRGGPRGELAGGARPVAGGTDLVVGARQGKAPLPEQHRRDPPRRRAARRRGARRTAACGSARSPRHARSPRSDDVRERFTALADASAIVGSHATRAQGTIGGNLMNASPAMETGGPLVCFGADGRRCGRAPTPREVAVADLLTGPGKTIAPRRTSCSSRSTCPLPRRGTGSAYVRLEYRRQMEIAVVGATAVVTLDGGKVTRRADRDHGALARRSGGCPRPRRRSSAATAATPPSRRRPPRRRGGDADLRRPRLGRLPPRDGRRDRPPRDRDRARTRARGGRRDEGRATLTRERRRLPGRARARHEPARRRARRRRPDRLEGGLRRLRVRRLHDAARRTSR